MRLKTSLRVGAAVALAAILAAPALAESIKEKQDKAKDQIPTCSHRIGSVAIYEPQNRWWEPLGLESPEALIKVLVMKSGCFTLVDRGKGFDVAQRERELASGGQLRGGSNIGKGQVKAADYVLVPDIVSKNADASNRNIGGLLGGLIGGGAGAIVGGLSLNSATADVVLTITDVRSSEQVAMTEGHGSKTDIGFGAGGGGIWGGGFGGMGISSYQHTKIGQVVTLAYIDAYSKLVDQLGGAPGNASAANETQALNVIKPGNMYKAASGKGGVVRKITPGMMLYPTGQKDGVWWQVKDEMGNEGWVSSLICELAK
ncbi:CsgG/HfaB family protein [Rhizomicrobium electricum]|uniref:CsgG/HfaB family protein n=1 Tax=Rhizomicrobium electricum TaxID=480070 RepID=A0ABP3PXW8_9PROT|nr:CsgG/HfaB family protein [Rhizomicrobium electricum]NIJ50117.1 curli biogenesis system outer membrane secretion channel CsgG [Rhizomicrobium electricum]